MQDLRKQVEVSCNLFICWQEKLKMREEERQARMSIENEAIRTNWQIQQNEQARFN